MGIKGLSKLIKAEPLKWADLRSYLLSRMDDDKLCSPAISVDAANIIYRASTWGASKLTDEKEKMTGHIKVILSFIKRLRALDIDMYWVFDHKGSNENGEFHLKQKQEEVDRRAAVKAKAQADLEEKRCEADEDAIVQAESAAFRLSTEIVDEVKRLLKYCGVKHLDAPAGYEGEHLCVELIKRGLCQAVLSNDMDCVAYGADIMLSKVNQSEVRTKKGDLLAYSDALSYFESERAGRIKYGDLSKAEPLTESDLIEICVMLGSDLAEKTPRAGLSNVFDMHLLRVCPAAFEGKRKGKLPKTLVAGAVLSERQIEAVELFKRRPEIPCIQVAEPDADGLAEWLGELKFSAKSIEAARLAAALPNLD